MSKNGDFYSFKYTGQRQELDKQEVELWEVQ